jgi:transposase
MTDVTIGMDLGDKNHEVCVLDLDGKKIDRFSVRHSREPLIKHFKAYVGALVAIETGTHSPWISRDLEALGCRTLVGNARKLRAIGDHSQKNDGNDAITLARIARFDPQLLHPIRHRNEKAQVDLEQIKARDLLVSTRTALINHVRGTVKSLGERLPTCSAASLHKKALAHLPEKLRSALLPVVDQIGSITEKIRQYERHIEALAKSDYPETQILRQVHGVGPMTSLAYVLTSESPDRFNQSRAVGPHLGLTPRQDQSGSINKQCRITKEGDVYLRRMLVHCSQYIMGHFGRDCDLRRYGMRLLARGGQILLLGGSL